MEQYKKTQYGLLLIALLLGGSIAAFIWGQFAWKKYALVVNAGGMIFLILILLLLLFYKLTITVKDGKITAKLGIGLIKKKVKLADIDRSTIQEVTVPWYYGIGIRLTPKGILYNVKFGNAIYFKAAGKTFYVGTDDFEGLKEAIVSEG